MLKIFLSDNFDKKLAPVRPERNRIWWEDNTATKDHARHCLPLAMANSLGYYILSPGTFIVKWDGNIHSRAIIEHIEKSTHYEVDNHAAFGSFTIQPQFIPVTTQRGEFVFIKGIPNERGLPYSCMEAVIEAWWSVGKFGLVFLLNQPGEFLINMGQPIAQMFVLSGVEASQEHLLIDGFPPGYDAWANRRNRKDYVKDLDYMKGFTATGEKVTSHITNWRDCSKLLE